MVPTVLKSNHFSFTDNHACMKVTTKWCPFRKWARKFAVYISSDFKFSFQWLNIRATWILFFRLASPMITSFDSYEIFMWKFLLKKKKWIQTKVFRTFNWIQMSRLLLRKLQTVFFHYMFSMDTHDTKNLKRVISPRLTFSISKLEHELTIQLLIAKRKSIEWSEIKFPMAPKFRSLQECQILSGWLILTR